MLFKQTKTDYLQGKEEMEQKDREACQISLCTLIYTNDFAKHVTGLIFFLMFPKVSLKSQKQNETNELGCVMIWFYLFL